MKIPRKVHAILTPAERRSALALLGLMSVGMTLETLGIGLVIPAVAILTRENVAGSYPMLRPFLAALGNPSRQELVIGGMLTLVGVYLVKALFLAFLAWRQARFAYGVQAQLSQRLFTTYLRQPYTFHLQRNSAQLIRNIVTEVNLFTGNAIIPLMMLLTEGLVLAGIGALLLVVEPAGAVFVAVVLGIMSWAFHHATRMRIARWGKTRQHHEGLRIQHLQQGLGGAKDVKLLGRESDFLAEFRAHNTQISRAAQMQSTTQQLSRLWLELLAVAGLATLVITMVMKGREIASVLPTLGLFGAAAFRLMPSINRVLAAMQGLRYGVPVIDTLHAELQLSAPQPPPPRIGRAPGFLRELRLDDVSFTYPSAARPSLNGISCEIRRGTCVGFIGPSGAGKSTLVDVILGLLSPERGVVIVDGKPIDDDLRAWQDQIGYVPQSIYLTDDTLRRNVAFGLPREQINDAAVREAIKAAQLEDFVASLPSGLDTIVGERGVRLSGGQRQRIGIARALYHTPAVLVLDEATSSLDITTEAGVMEAVAALHGMKTILIVAHRLSTVQYCDRLLHIDRGQIVSEGPPALPQPHREVASHA